MPDCRSAKEVICPDEFIDKLRLSVSKVSGLSEQEKQNIARKAKQVFFISMFE